MRIEEQNDVGSGSDSGTVKQPHEEAEILLRRIGSDVSDDQIVHALGSSQEQSTHPLESEAVGTTASSGDVASEEKSTGRNGGEAGGRFEGGESEEEEGEEKEEDADGDCGLGFGEEETGRSGAEESRCRRRRRRRRVVVVVVREEDEEETHSSSTVLRLFR